MSSVIIVLDDTNSTRRKELLTTLSSIQGVIGYDYLVIDKADAEDKMHLAQLCVAHNTDLNKPQYNNIPDLFFSPMSSNKLLIRYTGDREAGCGKYQNKSNQWGLINYDKFVRPNLSFLIKQYILTGQWRIENLCSGQIPWLREHSLEILEQCKTPQGFDKATKVFGRSESVDAENLLRYIQRATTKDGAPAWTTLEPFFKDARSKFDRLVSAGSERQWTYKNALDQDYVSLLQDLRDSLYNLVNEGREIGIS